MGLKTLLLVTKERLKVKLDFSGEFIIRFRWLPSSEFENAALTPHLSASPFA